MPLTILFAIACLITSLVISWRKPGPVAKISFCLLTLSLIFYTVIGALHAWGESQDIPFTISYTFMGIILTIMTVIRIRKA
jgi:hypothetical membrane protein